MQGCLAAVAQGTGVKFARCFVALQGKHLKDFGGIAYGLHPLTQLLRPLQPAVSIEAIHHLGGGCLKFSPRAADSSC